MNNVKTTSKKMIKGFMCQSPAATAVCMTGDGRSVIVPRRRPRIVLDSSRLINGANYSKHVECTRLGACRRPIFVPSGMVKREHHNYEPKSLPPSDNNVFQVVVMRVSLHCQGCAGKVKKHLSKMEGVTSYSIELESKRVTVMGHVSPAGVLESISKVKRAEFWPC